MVIVMMMAGIQGFAINILSVMTYMTITLRNQQHDANDCHKAYFPVLWLLHHVWMCVCELVAIIIMLCTGFLFCCHVFCSHPSPFSYTFRLCLFFTSAFVSSFFCFFVVLFSSWSIVCALCVRVCSWFFSTMFLHLSLQNKYPQQMEWKNNALLFFVPAEFSCEP